MKPTVVELFAGAGGAALGLHQAGFQHLALVEYWSKAAATLRAVGLPVIENRVENVSLVPYKRRTCLLWASPPCQPYSQAGKRLGELDPRDGWDATLIATRVLNPKVLIVENVGDAPVGDWAKQLKNDFPYVESFQLYAREFGVTQDRKRSFVYGGPVPFPWARLDKERRAPIALDKLIPHFKGHFVRLEHTTAKARPTSGASCPTLTTRGNLYVHQNDVGVRTKATRIDPKVSRPLSVDELAVIQGFPFDYPFQGGKGDAYKQIGNSVAPAVARAIGIAIRPLCALR